MRALCLAAALLLTYPTIATTQTRQRPAREAATPTPTPTHKATITLKGGESVTGLIVRADAKTLHVEVAGSPLTLPLENIESINFGNKPQPIAAPAPAEPQTGTLSIEAGLIYKVGGNQPVGRTEFHLLDEDAEAIVTRAGLRTDGRIGALSTYAIRSRYPTSRTPDVVAAEQALRSHIKFTVATDFMGKAQFTDIPPGRYFVFAQAQTRKGFALWNVPVEIKAGQNSIILDQNNAATAF